MTSVETSSPSHDLIDCKTTMLTMEQMVDVALGCPEIGAVNFNVLHCILQVILKETNLQRCFIEFSGHDAERMEGIVSNARPGPLLKLSEYMMDLTDGSVLPGDCSELTKTPRSGKSIRAEMERRKNKGKACCEPPVETKKKCPEKRAPTPPPINKCPELMKKSEELLSAPCDDENKIKDDKPEKTALEKEELEREERMRAKKERMEKSKNEKDVECKKKKKKKPCPCKKSTYYCSDGGGVTCVYQVETLGEKCNTWRSRPALAHESLVKLEEKVALLQECFEAMEGMPTNRELIENTKSKRPTPVSDMWNIFNLNKRMESAEGGITKLSSMMEDILNDCQMLKEALLLIAEEMENTDDFDKMSPKQKFKWLKEHVDELWDFMKKFTEVLSPDEMLARILAIPTMQKQLDNLEKEFCNFIKAFGEDGIEGFMKMIDAMQQDVANLNEVTQALLVNKEETDEKIKKLNEQVNLLNRLKADKAYMEDCLAAKADLDLVHRKVGHEQFDIAIDDLTKGLEDSFERISSMEAIWNEAMEELQKCLDNKLDKSEIIALKEFINKKLKALQDKLNELAKLRREAEAAGAKMKILRDVQCVSCNADAIMKMETDGPAPAPALEATRSMKPYLVYELDSIRKGMRKAPDIRSMNQGENSELECEKMKFKQQGPCDVDDLKLSRMEHLCNRYCGGSHTITTPQQRVTRIGHFLTEFGPHVMPLIQDNCMDNLSPTRSQTADRQ